MTIDSQTISEKLTRLIQQEIAEHGPITFAKFMQLALYAPGLGYYSAGSRKFGKEGDFVTAPEISSLFSVCIAKQCQQVLTYLNQADILELGAGSGVMAADILLELNKQHCLPEHYFILEISADLKERQQVLLKERLPDFFDRIIWLDKLPETFSGIMLANEVMDAMPVHRFKGSSQEYYVDSQSERFYWKLAKPSSSELANAIKRLDLPENYSSEINLQLPAWLQSLSDCLEKGVLLALDYGFPRHEYYHPERSMGTLMCHHRHKTHDNPLILVGLQDITAHVDFSAVVEGAEKAGFALAGYTHQAQFLLNLGLADLAAAAMTDDISRFEISQQIKLLTLPSEMGELFKAIALSKNVEMDLLGFEQGNRPI